MILDAVGKHSFHRSRRSLNAGGIYLTVGLGFMYQAPLVALVTRFAGSRRAKLAIGRYRREDLLLVKELVDTGKYRPVVDRTYELDEAVEANPWRRLCVREPSARAVPGARDQHQRPAAGTAGVSLPRRGRAGGLPRPSGRVRSARERRRAPALCLGLHFARIRVTWPGLVRTTSFQPRSLASGACGRPVRNGVGSGFGASELAARYGASAEVETPHPREAYGRFERPQPGRPEGWKQLPWAQGGSSSR